MPNVCFYPNCSHNGALSAYCNGNSWSLHENAFPSQGATCVTPPAGCADSGVSECSCMTADVGSFWQCSRGSACYPEPQPGDPCPPTANGATCFYSAQHDGGLYRCSCTPSADAGGESYQWTCFD